MKTNWQTKKLGKVCDVLDNKRKPITKRNRTTGEYPYYGATGILDYVGDYIFDEKLVLIGEDGAKWESGEHTAFIAEGKYWVNNHAHVIRPHRDIILDNWIIYLFYFNDLTKHTTGLTVPKLNQANLRNIKIPLPPLSEQHRIVKILDGVFADVAKAKESAEKNFQNAKELFESYLNNIFANPEKGWEEKILNDVCEDILAGGDKPKGAFSKFKTDEFQIPIFSNGIKNDGLYGYTNTARIKKPSITISARGTIGYSVIRREVFFPIIRLIVLTPDDDLIDLDFLHYSIKNNSIIGNGTSIPQLTVPAVKKIKISFPKSLKIQKEIIKKLDELSNQTKKLESIYQQKLSDLEELKKSVLKKAFCGEL